MSVLGAAAVSLVLGILQYAILNGIERLLRPRKSRYAYAFSVGGIGGGLVAAFVATVVGSDLVFVAAVSVVLFVTIVFVLHGALMVVPKQQRDVNGLTDS